MQQLLAAMGGSGFNPKAIGGLELWLKADSLSLANNADVTTWPDHSGNGNDATVSMTAPAFKTNRINGKPAVYFDGGIGPGMDLPSITYRTIFVVAKNSNAAATTTDPTIFGKAAGLIAYIFSSYYVQGRSPYSSGNFSITTIHHNGFAVGPGSSAYNNSYFPLINFWCGTLQSAAGVTSDVTLGNYDYNINYSWNGDVAEILVYSTALDSTDIASVEAYLMNKYALPETPFEYLSCFDGDSMPLIPEQPFGFDLQPSLGNNWQYRNFSVGSQRTDQILARQATTLASYNASYTRNIITSNMGTNDLTQSIAPAVAEANLATWCTNAQNVGFKVVVTTLVPNSNAGLPVDYDTNRLIFNDLIRTNYTNYADALVDLANDSSLQVNPGTNYFDGTHFSIDVGHPYVASLLLPVIQSLA